MIQQAPSPEHLLRLPEVLPVFPLTGVLLLPGTLLPLHVFEPRYRHLVDDALAAERLFGIIQPVVPRQDNRPLPGAESESPELYPVGCAGFIERDERLPDGRHLVTLRGVCRFRVIGELPLQRGYRRVRADYAEFAGDRLPAEWTAGRAMLLEALRAYCRARGLVLETQEIDTLGDRDLLQAIAVTLPLHPSEKQALLEAANLAERERVLTGLLRMAGEAPPERDASSEPLN